MAFRRSGPLRVWRIADGRFPVFDGAGAARHGGRWNSPGRRVIYAAETYAGAVLEKLVHTNIGSIPAGQRHIEIWIPAGVVLEEAGPEDMRGWDHGDYGDRWYDQQRTVVLQVPSMVALLEHNVLINQLHPEFRRLRASEPKPVLWDQRLFRH